MTILANIAPGATAGTPAVAYTCPANKIATVNVHALNTDAASAALFKLFLVPAGAAALSTATLQRAAMTDLVQLGANGGQFDRSGIILAAGDTIQYDTTTAVAMGIVIDGIVGSA